MMRRISLLVLCLIALSCTMITPAHGHYVCLEPQGLITTTAGEALTVAAYLHAESTDLIWGWGFSQVFDSVELSPVSFAWGSSTAGTLGDAYYTDQVWNDNYVFLTRMTTGSVALTAGTDYALFSVTYTFNGGAFDGSDVWIDWDLGADVFFGFGPQNNQVYLGPDELNQGYLTIHGSGPDYGSNAVPIPGAVWLLGSGLVALVGLNRRTSL